MPERNKELFYKIADEIEKDTYRYDQAIWGGSIFRPTADTPECIEDTINQVKELACGTAHCIAGHAAMLSGWTPKIRKSYGFSSDGFVNIEINWEELEPPEGETNPDLLSDPHPGNLGERLLGLRPEEANVLFSEYWRPVDWRWEHALEDEPLSAWNAMAVGNALRSLGNGASISEVTLYEDEPDW